MLDVRLLEKELQFSRNYQLFLISSFAYKVSVIESQTLTLEIKPAPTGTQKRAPV